MWNNLSKKSIRRVYNDTESINRKKVQDKQGEAVQGNADGEHGSGIV